MKQIFNKKWLIAAVAVVAALAVLVGGFFLVTKLLIPASTYRRAEGLIASGDYERAYTLFRSLGNYRDAKDRLNDFLWVCDSYTVDDAALDKEISYHYSYDDAGNLLEKKTTVDGKTVTTTYTYDDKGNELSCTVSTAEGTENSENTTYVYDANGNVLNAMTVDTAELSTEVVYAYDENGNRIKATKTLANGISDEWVYIYDEQNNLTEARRGKRVRFLYDTDGNLVKKISLNNEGKNIGTYTYDEQGTLLSMTSDASDATILCTLDRKGRVLTREYKNFTPSSKEEYTYDSQGNVKKAVIDLFGAETTHKEYTYTYSKEGDVLTETVLAGEGAEPRVNRWTYDAYGNVLTCENDQKTAEASGWRVFLRKDAGQEPPFARTVTFEFADMKSLEKDR